MLLVQSEKEVDVGRSMPWRSCEEWLRRVRRGYLPDLSNNFSGRVDRRVVRLASEVGEIELVAECFIALPDEGGALVFQDFSAVVLHESGAKTLGYELSSDFVAIGFYVEAEG